MEPVSTFAEVARILQPGGVFAAYDYDLLPTVHWEAEQAFVTFMARVRQLRRAHAVPPGIQEWEKADHLHRLQESRQFRYVKELLLHHTEPCTAERWVGFALTLREVAPVLDLGLEEEALGLEAFRQAADQTLGHCGLPWYISYRVRVGVKSRGCGATRARTSRPAPMVAVRTTRSPPHIGEKGDTSRPSHRALHGAVALCLKRRHPACSCNDRTVC
jgi:hypothetical protein